MGRPSVFDRVVVICCLAGSTDVTTVVVGRCWYSESIPRRHVAGGQLVPSIRSATACIARCVHQRRRRRSNGGSERGDRREGRCVAVDFDTTNNTCWLHSASTGCAGDSAMLPLASSTHYRVRRHACHNLSQSLLSWFIKRVSK